MHYLTENGRLDSPKIVDAIEKMVYDYLKLYGFRKHGRTLHRFVDGDISQLVNFQNGCPGKGIFDVLWINLGIRVPECVERTFDISQPLKKYYHEYECNMRTRLGMLVDKKDTYYHLAKDPVLIGKSIIERLEKYVLPVYELLDSRDSILEHRKAFPEFDIINHKQALLEAVFIYGRRGEKDIAAECFQRYYNECCDAFRQDMEKGREIFLRKGACMTYIDGRTNRECVIRATEDGPVTIFDARNSHIKYLEALAEKLNLPLEKM